MSEANRNANPSPYRDLVVPRGVKLSLISEDVERGLSGLRTGTVRPELLPEYRLLADALASETTGVQEESPGSNNWAISGRLTASGRVIVPTIPTATSPTRPSAT